MLGIIIVLCGLVVIAAVMAERSARSHRRFRAIGLNLVGLLCLGVGLGAIFAWSHGISVEATQVAVAAAVDADSQATVADVVNSTLDADLDTETIPLNAEDDDNVEATPEAEDGASASDAESSNDAAEIGDIHVMSKVFIDYDARPEWVDREDVTVGPVHQISVCSGPHMQRRESRKALRGELKKAVDQYINDLVEHPQAAFWLGLDEKFISTNLIQPDNMFDEKIISPSFGVMHQSHALVEIGPQFRDHVETSWHQFHAKGRLVVMGLICGGVLGVILALFGYFRADTATRGFYTGRLKFVTAAAILALVVAGVILAQSIPWLWI
jgi:uncharacterized membrane protein YidH (DUF202 family)